MEDILKNREIAGLSNEEIGRYSRHLLLPEIGIEGQKRFKTARVLIVGTGGLGAPLAMYLAAAGVGTIGLVDFDLVEASNLQRQIIHSARDIGRPKTASAQDRLKGINPYIRVITHNTTLTSENALDIMRDYDIVADGTDNYQTRYLVNDACVMLGIPNVYGSIFQFEGQSSVFYAKEGPCYRCLYPEPPPPGLVPSCAEGGVLGVLPGIVGCIQANEVLKLIARGAGNENPCASLTGRLLMFDAWKMKFRELSIEKDPACPMCGKNPSITELIDYEQFCGIKKQADELDGFLAQSFSATELKKRIDSGEAFQIIDTREPHERAIAKFPSSEKAVVKIIPLGQMERRMGELDPAIPAVFLCKVGKRSVYAIRDLREAGYTGKMFNLAGGVNAWATDVDTSLPVY
jgi:adenylyltransferase/sulfurtransferase